MKNRRIAGLLIFVALALCSVFAFTACADTPVCTVSFETNGGTEYSRIQTVTEGQEIRLPLPEKFGCQFLGWYDNADCSGDALGESYVPTGNITLYAKWRELTYTVSFVSNCDYSYRSVQSNGQQIELPEPTKPGFVFDGWYRNADFEGKAYRGTYRPDRDITLYAKWRMNVAATVNFHSNGGSDLDSIYIREAGESITLPVPEKYGYDFTGWYKEKDCSDEKIDGVFAPNTDIDLYAGWVKVVYLYIYFGRDNTYKRISFAPGTSVKTSELEIPDTLEVDGKLCPFVGLIDVNGESLPAEITLSAHTYIFAEYDYSDVPAYSRVKKNEDGSYTAKGKAVLPLIDEGVQEGGYSIDMSFAKGSAGCVNIAWRMGLSGNVLAYEDAGSYYLIAGVYPANGNLEIHKVTDGKWSRFKKIEFQNTPSAWRERYNAARLGDILTVNLTVYDYGTSFEVYLDGVLVYENADVGILNNFTSTAFGFRSNTKESDFFNYRFGTFKTLSFQTNGGSEIADMTYAVGRLDVPVPLKENGVFSGWYYDEALTQKVDMDNPVINADATLYAGYDVAEINITLNDGDAKLCSYGYYEDNIYLPTLDNKANRMFTGWYFDAACTRAVNVDEFSINEDTTLYAGWRRPTHNSITDNGDGTVTVGNSEGALVIAETQFDYTQYTMNFAMSPSQTGVVSIAFRMSVYTDNAMNDNKATDVCKYISVGINRGSGGLVCGKVSGGFKSTNVTIANLPATWKEKFNAAKTDGSEINVTLTVRDYGAYYEVYIDGALAYTSTDDIGAFDGIGYGIRSSAKNITVKLSIAELKAYTLNLVDGQSSETVKYFVVKDTLPILENRANRIFTGWYFDVDCKNKVGEVTSDATLYAGWRRPTHNSITDNGDGTVTVGNSEGALVIAETQFDYTQYTMNFAMSPSQTGVVSIAFRMSVYTDNAMNDNKATDVCKYISVGINRGSGGLVCGKVSGGFKSTNVTIANLPATWKEKFNAAKTDGSEINVTLTVRDYGAYYEVYIDGALAYTSTDDIGAFDGIGYGIRSSAKNITVKLSIAELTAKKEQEND